MTKNEMTNQAAQTMHPDALPDGTLSKSTVKRVEALVASGGEDGWSLAMRVREALDRASCPDHFMRIAVETITGDAPHPPAAASVSERARALLAAEYRSHGWHEDAGRLCMGGDPTSFVEDDALRVIDRLIEQGDEDAHVITELGRLLASIAVILKGPEPAGTAWSYHDLPSLVASEVAEPRQVAAEMKAWAHTKMAEQQSSRRDRMMVVEWAKRLLPESSFPVKDFDVEGMSITKEAAREAVKRVALEQALTQQRGHGEAVDRDAWAEALELPEGYTVEEFLPGGWHYAWTRADGERMVSGTTWNHPALAAIAAWQCAPATTPQPSADAVREVPDGMVLVPREPDVSIVHEMREAYRSVRRGGIGGQTLDASFQREYAPELAAYHALLAAASGEKGVR